jgi:predicted ATPase
MVTATVVNKHPDRERRGPLHPSDPSQTSIAGAISLVKELNDMSSLAFALYFAGILARFECNPAEVERRASELIELATRYNFAFWLPGATVLRGWAHSISGNAAEGISLIEQGVEDYRATGSVAGLPMWLALKAEALYLADHTSKALETISEAETLAEKFEVGWWYGELRRLRGVFLAATGAEETRIEASFQDAIRIAREQKAISVEKRTEASYAEHRQKAGALGGHEIRLPLW